MRPWYLLEFYGLQFSEFLLIPSLLKLPIIFTGYSVEYTENIEHTQPAIQPSYLEHNLDIETIVTVFLFNTEMMLFPVCKSG